MADTLQTTALITIAQNYAGDVVRQINRTSALLALLSPTFRAGEGANIAMVAESSGAVAGTFAEGADYVNFGSDAQAPATLPFARYAGTFHVTGNAMMAARTSRTPAGNIELWARNIVNASEALAKAMNGDLYTGAGGDAFVGLDAAIGNAGNVYAGIDRAANAYWRPTVVDSGAAPLSFALLRADLAAIKVASGYKPDIALVGSATYNEIAGLFDSQKFYVYQTMDLVKTSKSDITLDGGTGCLKFDGTYFVEDAFAPPSSIYYLNSGLIEVQYQEAVYSLPMGATDEAMEIGGLTDGFDTIPLGMILELLAKTGDAQKGVLKCYPQLCVKRPNAFGKRFNFT